MLAEKNENIKECIVTLNELSEDEEYRELLFNKYNL